MTDFFVRGPVGNVAHTVTGVATICGPDDTTSQGSDGNDGSEAEPWLTLDGSFASTFLNAGDTVYCSGRVRMSGDFNDYCLHVDGIAGAINVRQWPGQPQAFFYAYKMPGGFEDGTIVTGGVALAQNKTIGAGFWTAVGANNAYSITCDGTDNKANLTEANLITGIACVVFDFTLAANFQTKTVTNPKTGASVSFGLPCSHLRAPTATGVGVTVRGAWLANQTGAGGTLYYAVGDTVKESTVTYICITAHNSAAAFVTDAAKWETFAAQKTRITVTDGAAGAFGKWCWDFQTGELVVRFPSGSTPATATANGIEYALTAKTALYYSSVGGTFTWINCVVDGIWFAGWGDAKAVAPFGTAINMSFTQDCSITNCHFLCNGDHALAGGSKVNNITYSGLTIIGGEAGCYFVIFNASGVGQTASGEIRDSLIYTATWQGHDLLTIGNTAGGIGVYIHGPHTQVKITRVGFVNHVPASGQYDFVQPINGDDGTAPSDLTRARYRPIYAKDCWQVNGSGWGAVGQSTNKFVYIGHENCRYTLDNSYKRLDGGYPFSFGAAGCAGDTLFEGCELKADLRNSNGAASNALFNISAKYTIRLLNTSTYDLASTHSDAVGRKYAIGRFAATPDGVTGFGFIVSGSVMGYRDVTTGVTNDVFQVVINDTGIAAGFLAFTNNVYFNIGATTWAEDGARNTAAEWLSTVDTGQIDNGTTNFYASAAGASLEPTAAGKAVRKVLATHAAAGFNSRSYSGQYGGWQAGGGGGPRLNRPRRVVRAVR